VLLDLTKSEDQLLSQMHKKHKYNILYAQKKSLKARIVSYDQSPGSAQALDNFYSLYKSTADRQKYYTHSKKYFELIWNILGESGITKILNISFENKILSSWMLFVHDGVLYYPYGGSSTEHKNLYASNLIGWEAIKFGKSIGCHTFDMWGACKDPNDSTDPWWGFTNFKLKFGGKHVTHIDSYDFVVNRPLYNAFVLVNDLRWKLLKLLK
jgi:lipid II:glycine glycyltransferase (peptidoglycan interpeptide bridge formation enzyme)